MIGKVPKDDPLFAGSTIRLTAKITFIIFVVHLT